MDTVGWNFPSNNKGEITGVADAGIQLYTANTMRGIIKSLTRETCQNSLDAVAPDKDCVIMEFKQHYVDSNYIPGRTQYKKILERAFNYWKNNSEMAANFLKEAIKAIDERNTIILRISDYNTEGLLEPGKPGFGSWNNLIKIGGGAIKETDKAGRYGIGKKAPFACSIYRMVFYRTYNIDGERAVQGVCRLLSYPIEGSDELTSGIGYYGNIENNGPVNCINKIDELYKRTDYGTDIFVYGLRMANTKNVQTCIFTEILNNFIISIYRKKLIVHFNKEKINKENLEVYVKSYKANAYDAYCAWMALEEKEKKTVDESFHGMGTLHLTILVDEKKKLNQKILVTRKSGMKLFLMGRISNVIPFTGILELQGKELNKFFGEMEPPAHDAWDSTIHSNPKLADQYIKEVKKWIISKVNEFGKVNFDDNVNVENIGGILNEQDADSKDSEDGQDYKGKEKLEGHPNSVQENKSLIKDDIGGGIVSIQRPKRGGRKKPGTIDESNIDDVARGLNGERPRPRIIKEHHTGVPNPKGKDIANDSKDMPRLCNLKNIRIIKISGDTYTLSCNLPYDFKSGHIKISTVGENRKPAGLNIVKVEPVNNCICILSTNNKIVFDRIHPNKKVRMDFTLGDSQDYAMEVEVYEYI